MIKEVAENLLGPEIGPLFMGLLKNAPTVFTDQGLWFVKDDLFTARFYSQLLALQIKARGVGLLLLNVGVTIFPPSALCGQVRTQ